MQNKMPPQGAALKALVVDSENRILLGRRIDQTDNGLFEFPGGIAEEGEDLDEALKREVKEETGVGVEPMSLSKDEGTPLKIAQSKTKRAVLMFFLAKVVNKEGMFAESDEMSEINFYTKDEVRGFLERDEVRKINDELVKRYLDGEFDEN